MCSHCDAWRAIELVDLVEGDRRLLPVGTDGQFQGGIELERGVEDQLSCRSDHPDRLGRARAEGAEELGQTFARELQCDGQAGIDLGEARIGELQC